MLALEAGTEGKPADRLARLVLDYVSEQGSINSRECRDLLGWEEKKRGKAYRLLRRLVREGKLHKEGRGRGTRYTHL